MEIFENEKNVVLREFLQQYPQYNDDKYIFKVCLDNSHDGDYCVYLDEEDCYVAQFWCKLWNNEQETTYEFEEMGEVNVMKIRPNIDVDDFCVYYDYDADNYTTETWIDNCAVLHEVDYNKVETNVVNQFVNENEQVLRQYIASKILDGTIPITFSCVDTDVYNVPIKHLKQKIYKV